MKRTNLLIGAGSVLFATGVVGVGMAVSSGAMAESAGASTDAVVSMVTLGEDGDAFACEVSFDSLDLPVSEESLAVEEVTATAGAGGAEQVDGASIVAPVEAVLGTLEAEGSVVASVTPEFGVIEEDGTTTPLEVRDGTPEECEAVAADFLNGGGEAAAVVGESVVPD